MIEKLIEEHDHLRATARALAEAASAPTPASTEALDALRWTLARESLQHLANDERYVLVPLEQSSDARVRAIVAEFRADLDAFNADFKQHMADWTGAKVQRRWSAYGASVREQVARLEDRLMREERTLYPLARNLTGDTRVTPSRNWARDAWDIKASIQGG